MDKPNRTSEIAYLDRKIAYLTALITESKKRDQLAQASLDRLRKMVGQVTTERSER